MQKTDPGGQEQTREHTHLTSWLSKKDGVTWARIINHSGDGRKDWIQDPLEDKVRRSRSGGGTRVLILSKWIWVACTELKTGREKSKVGLGGRLPCQC